ncbi:alpha/beta hydrolase family protein [Lacrimispora sp. JR3]|uniref:alpha/beta hydrolase family protein n=1 Tax=Lacrimispora sinapis TaxID=3111456 RepID=UPI00374A1C09
MTKKAIKMIAGMIIFILVCIVVIIQQNTFDMKVTSVQIPTSKGVLNGSIVLPKEMKERVGLVIFIHGDGPANASYNSQYNPLWEELASLGYASLSWSKPGIDGSSGNWLTQSMEDRASEALEVINWARTLPEINLEKIGLWGSSQAGWVIPKINREDKNIAFNILVAPAINWVDQGLYNTLAEMKREGKSLKDQEQAKEEFLWSISMLDKNATYEEYHNNQNADKSITKERWNFISKNYKSDATEDIQYFYSPVKLFLGGKDIHVDSNDTKRVYKNEVSEEFLSVTWISSTDHYMLRPYLVNSKLFTTLTGLFAPRQLADREYYAGIKEFLQLIDDTH